MYVIELYPASDGWRWRRRARHGGEIVASGEAYTRKWNAKRAVRKQYPDDQILEPSE